MGSAPQNQPPDAPPEGTGGAAPRTGGEPAAPGEAPPDERGVQHLARKAVRLYKNIDKVDRWGGYGWTISTVVKIVGWTGLLVVLAILVAKLKDIQHKLDPVTSNVSRLQSELADTLHTVESARARISANVKASQDEVERLGAAASLLRRQLAEGAAGEAKDGAAALKETVERSRALATRLQSEGKILDEISQGLGSLSTGVDGYVRSVASARGSLDDSATATGAQLKAVSAALDKLGQRTTALADAVGRLKTPEAELAKVEGAVEALGEAVARASAKMKALEQRLDAREKAASAAATAATAPGAAPGPTPTAAPVKTVR